MADVPDKLDQIDVEITASNKLFDELQAVVKKYHGHPKLSTYTVLGALETLKAYYLATRILTDEEED